MSTFRFTLPPLPPTPKLPLPCGKLTVRFRSMRGVWQCFTGREYLLGASGDSPDEAVDEMRRQYEVREGARVEVKGMREPHTIVVGGGEP